MTSAGVITWATCSIIHQTLAMRAFLKSLNKVDENDNKA